MAAPIPELAQQQTAKLVRANVQRLRSLRRCHLPSRSSSRSILFSPCACRQVLLGEMGSGKSSLVLRYVKGQFFDYQVSRRSRGALRVPDIVCVPQGHMRKQPLTPESALHPQASTVGAAFLTKTLPELNVKFEIWYVHAAKSLACFGLCAQ